MSPPAKFALARHVKAADENRQEISVEQQKYQRVIHSSSSRVWSERRFRLPRNVFLHRDVCVWGGVLGQRGGSILS